MKRQRILTSIILSSILGMGFYTAPAFAETAAGITVGKIDRQRTRFRIRCMALPIPTRPATTP